MEDNKEKTLEEAMAELAKIIAKNMTPEDKKKFLELNQKRGMV